MPTRSTWPELTLAATGGAVATLLVVFLGFAFRPLGLQLAGIGAFSGLVVLAASGLAAVALEKYRAPYCAGRRGV